MTENFNFRITLFVFEKQALLAVSECTMLLLSLLVFHLGQKTDTCPSNVMHGFSLGPTVDTIQKPANNWEECHDLCCKSNACIAWTLLKEEKICFLRSELRRHVQENENEISGITKAYALPSPHRKELRYYIGILSAAKNRERVNMLVSNAFVCLVSDTVLSHLRKSVPSLFFTASVLLLIPVALYIFAAG